MTETIQKIGTIRKKEERKSPIDFLRSFMNRKRQPEKPKAQHDSSDLDELRKIYTVTTEGGLPYQTRKGTILILNDGGLSGNIWTEPIPEGFLANAAQKVIENIQQAVEKGSIDPDEVFDVYLHIAQKRPMLAKYLLEIRQ